MNHVYLRFLKYEISSNENGGKVLFEIKRACTAASNINSNSSNTIKSEDIAVLEFFRFILNDSIH